MLLNQHICIQPLTKIFCMTQCNVMAVHEGSLQNLFMMILNEIITQTELLLNLINKQEQNYRLVGTALLNY